MPLSRVVESFDIRTTRFDVVILDEASQSDVLGLAAFALGKEVVVGEIRASAREPRRRP